MAIWKTLAFGSLVLGLAACSPSPGPSDGGDTQDASTQDVRTQDAPTQDASTQDVRAQDAMAPADAGGGDGGTANFGACGRMVHDCICACPAGNQMCPAQCVANNMTCNRCVFGAAAQCCPSEAMALDTCVRNAMMASDAGPACTDDACIQMRCMAQINAFNTCFAMQQQNSAMCRGYVGQCLGTYPVECM
jgi:hypothetical protein